MFFHFIRTKRPYVVMKYAMTLDGKIATAAWAGGGASGPGGASAEDHRHPPGGGFFCWKGRWTQMFTGIDEEMGAIRRGARASVLSIGARTVCADL